MQTLSEREWRHIQAEHVLCLRPHVDRHLYRASRGIKHPVYDFLWQYYTFRPAQLLRWTPGAGVVLRGGEADSFLAQRYFSRVEGGVWLDPARFPERRRDAMEGVLALLTATAEREPRFGCHGLHEWAMVYRESTVRHDQVQLRMPSDDLAAFVESQPICCSHYDAYRFFTPPARPLNRLRPGPGTRVEMEQSGCVHANMDLYKWAYMFYPWLSGNPLADAFLLACQARELDMRASPYDLSAYDVEPIRIEEAEGREQYRLLQQEIADKARPVRERLIAEYCRVLGLV